MDDMIWAITVGVIVITGIITDMITSNKKIELKKIEAELKLEQLKLENYERETEKMRLELEHSKQLLLEKRDQ